MKVERINLPPLSPDLASPLDARPVLPEDRENQYKGLEFFEALVKIIWSLSFRFVVFVDLLNKILG